MRCKLPVVTREHFDAIAPREPAERVVLGAGVCGERRARA